MIPPKRPFTWRQKGTFTVPVPTKHADDTIIWKPALWVDGVRVSEVTMHRAPLELPILDSTIAGYITGLETKSEHRGQGHGLAIVNAATDFLHREGLRYVIAFSENPESRALFLRAGYWQSFVKNRFGDIAMVHGEPKPPARSHWEPRGGTDV
ncbi:MAG: GNAT family N-acetyltransferase [Dehalococcoidia bacterium]|nr:GNAT family N-acetyltransferase [Dehalococcoidia bacterium]